VFRNKFVLSIESGNATESNRVQKFFGPVQIPSRQQYPEGQRIPAMFRISVAEFRKERLQKSQLSLEISTQNPNYAQKFLGRVQKYMHLLDSSIRKEH
jgi:hypothetical protein